MKCKTCGQKVITEKPLSFPEFISKREINYNRDIRRKVMKLNMGTEDEDDINDYIAVVIYPLELIILKNNAVTLNHGYTLTLANEEYYCPELYELEKILYHYYLSEMWNYPDEDIKGYIDEVSSL